MATSSAKPTVIEIMNIERASFNITIVGDTPLIVHAWSEKAKRMILDKQTGKATASKNVIKIPYNDFADSLYWLTPKPEHGKNDEEAERNVLDAIENGARFGFRADGIKAAAAATPKRIGQKIDGTDMRASFFIKGATDASTAELAEIVGPAPVMREDMVRVGGQSKTADIRYRAMFEEWRIPLEIIYNANGKISVEQIVNAINVSGFAIGIGEWRPDKKGQFGMFHVE